MKKKTIAIIILSLIVEAVIIGTFAFSKYDEISREKIEYEEKYEEMLKVSSKLKIALAETEELLTTTQEALVETEEKLTNTETQLKNSQSENSNLKKEIENLKAKK